MPGPGLPADQEVNFRLQSENWSQYEVLQGRAIIWLRAILTKLYYIDDDTFMTATKTPVRAYIEDKSLQGEPSSLSNEEIRQKLHSGEAQDLEFEALDEPWNEYRALMEEPKIVRTKAVATGISYLPDIYSDSHDPVFNVDSEVVVGEPTDAAGQVST